ncbi:MAG: FecR domain-containing protein [Cyanobacteria bacterium J06627_32]
MVKLRSSLVIAVLLGFLLSFGVAQAQQSLRLRGNRWLSVSNLTGYVEIVPRESRRRRAVKGDRLDMAGDVLITGPSSTARLDIDQAAGFITMAENSRIQVQTLSVTGNGGYITEMYVTQGQARLRLRSLTNPASRIEIYTPAGVSGVRGTDFGVAVGPDGRTGVATLEGSVASSAQGQTVVVNAQQQSTIRPGEPPTPPEPLRDDPSLYIQVLRILPGRTDAAGRSIVQVAGYTDPVNLLKINSKEENLGRDGQFDVTLPLLRDRSLDALVVTPLGTQQKYELVLP